MKHTTVYGSIELEVNTDKDGNVTYILKSDIPFKEVETTYSDPAEAAGAYQELVKEVEKIIKRMQKTKKAKSEKGRLYKALKSLFRPGKRILLYGPTGTGKTTVARNVMNELKEKEEIKDFVTFVMSSGMEDIDLLGKFIPGRDGNLTFQPSVFYNYVKMAETDKIGIIIDEFNRSSPKTLNILIPLLDVKDEHVYLNNFISNEIIKVPAENLMLVFTANLGTGYAGTDRIDTALLNRVDYTLFVDYQKDIEDSILKSLVDTDIIEIVENLVRYCRKAYKEGIADEPFSTRDLINLVEELERIKTSKGALDTDHIYAAFYRTSLFKVCPKDSLGYPLEDFIETVKKVINGEEVEDA